MATGKPVSKILIKYNSNSLKKNIKGKEGANWIEFTEQKADPEVMKMLLTLNK